MIGIGSNLSFDLFMKRFREGTEHDEWVKMKAHFKVKPLSKRKEYKLIKRFQLDK